MLSVRDARAQHALNIEACNCPPSSVALTQEMPLSTGETARFPQGLKSRRGLSLGVRDAGMDRATQLDGLLEGDTIRL